MSEFKKVGDLLDMESKSEDHFDIAAYQVKQFNSKIVNNDFICNQCNGSGKIAFLDEAHNFALKDCSCKKKRYAYEKLKKYGLYDFLRRIDSIDKLPENEEWEKAVKDTLKDFVSNHKKIFWLFIGGQVGSGKTTKATMILKVLLEQEDSLSFEYFNWDTRYKELIFSKAREELLKDLQEVDILYLDDFFRHSNGNLAETEREVAKAIIDYRYLNKKQTIITSELLLSEITNLDEAIGSRIFQMCGKNRFTIQIARDKSRNYRSEGMNKIL